MGMPSNDVGDLDRISQLIEEGKIRAVVGCVVKLSELQEIRDACTAIKAGRGGVGKFVVDVQDESTSIEGGSL